MQSSGYWNARHSPAGDTLSPMAAKYPAKRPQLSVHQIELVAQFADFSYEYPRLSFTQVAKKILGGPFPNTLAGRQFKREAKEVFDRERLK